jgi:hypothetical protein
VSSGFFRENASRTMNDLITDFTMAVVLQKRNVFSNKEFSLCSIADIACQEKNWAFIPGVNSTSFYRLLI